jgi:hypothetical protein
MGRAMTDPVFLADFRAQGELFWCLRCHAPLEEQRPLLDDGLATLRPLSPTGVDNPAFDAALQAEGVTCVVCHQHEGAMVGGLADPQGAPHAARAGAEARDPQTCGRCHQLEAPPFTHLARPISDTVAEWQAWRATTGRPEDCVHCHMPTLSRAVATGGPVRTSHDHRFPGAWDESLLRSAVVLVEAAIVPGAVKVVLRNEAGHNVPSGDPARALIVEAEAGGRTVEHLLARRVPLPRLRDEGDSTLRPGETREILLPLPGAEGGATVRLRFDPLAFLPVIAEQAGLPPAARMLRIAERQVSP